MKRKINYIKVIVIILVFIGIIGSVLYLNSRDKYVTKKINILDFDDASILEDESDFILDTTSLASAVSSSNSIKYTNKNVTLKINVKMSNFNYIKFPDGTVGKDKNSTYEVSKNGTYKFLLYDNDNNYKEKVIKVNKIDKTNPTGSCTATVENGKTTILVDGKDELSGINSYVYYGNGQELKKTSASTYSYDKEFDNVHVVIYDNATNNSLIVCKVTNANGNNNNQSIPTPNPNISIKTHDQRNDAIKYYDTLQTKNIKSVDKQYKCSKISCDIPNPYYPNMNGNIKLSIYDEKTGTTTYLKTITKEIAPYVMVPNVVYYLEEEANPSNKEYIKLTGDLRMINVDGTRNVRDLGGYQADGGKIKYGILFRGANPNHSSKDSSTTNIFNNLGIKVIFDLRETSSWKKVKDKYLTSFEKMNSDTGYYLSSKKYKNTRTSVEQIMKQVVDNKGVYFHCAIGTDRTGTVANLLEGILGVPNEVRLDDYELSYFYKHSSGTVRTGGSINGILKKVSKFGGSDDQEKYINWFLSDSKNVQEDINLINNFRKTMIDGTPTFYKVEGKTCVKMSGETEQQTTPQPNPTPEPQNTSYYPVITPKSDEKVAYKSESDSLKVYVTTKSGWYLTRIWAKDAVNQMHQQFVNSNSLKKPVELLKTAINDNNLKNKIVVGFNANPPVKKGSYYDAIAKKDSFYDYKVPVPLMIYNGNVLYNDYEKYSSDNYVFYIDRTNQLKYVPIMTNNTVEERRIAFQNVIDSGTRNTFTFHPILVLNSQVQDVSNTKSTNAKRNAICQIDDNNFIIITTKKSTLYIQDFANYVGTLGCKTAFNFDGGGSTALFYKDAKSSSPKTLSGGGRALSAVMYFTELN